MSDIRAALCPRCGTPRPAIRVAPGETMQGECENCGLGFTGGSMTLERATPASDDKQQALLELMRDRGSAAVDRWDGPAYELDDSWQGQRFVGGWGEGTSGRHLELGHGDPMGRHPSIRIRTALGPYASFGEPRDLVQWLWHAGASGYERLQPTFTSSDPTATWDKLMLLVDNEPTVFRSLRDAENWVALAQLGPSWVSIESVGVPSASIRLRLVRDWRPYQTP